MLIINLKTAKALGLEIPATSAARRRGDRVSDAGIAQSRRRGTSRADRPVAADSRRRPLPAVAAHQDAARDPRQARPSPSSNRCRPLRRASQASGCGRSAGGRSFEMERPGRLLSARTKVDLRPKLSKSGVVVSSSARIRHSPLVDLAWRTVYPPLGYPVARAWWALRRPPYEGAVVAVSRPARGCCWGTPHTKWVGRVTRWVGLGAVRRQKKQQSAS